MSKSTEHQRLEDYRNRKGSWKLWGPYLSERAWGTVREDYSATGDAWHYFPFQAAHRRAYRWNEDGLAGISDRNQHFCFALALWNGKDQILKERLFGLTNTQGNHGEDVKECYFYLDSTPTHSYMKYLYKYPQNAFPYDELIRENGKRSYNDKEYELEDTGAFDDNKYFDVVVEYAMAAQDDILVRIEIFNRGEEAATCHLLPTFWFRNTWSWGYPNGPQDDISGKPYMMQIAAKLGISALEAFHPTSGTYFLYADGAPQLLFTENETNLDELYSVPNDSPYTKDGINRYVVDGDYDSINPEKRGTKAAAYYKTLIQGGKSAVFNLRITPHLQHHPFSQFQTIFQKRKAEAEEFYAVLQDPALSDEQKSIQRQAFAGLLWGKQLYYYDIEQWLEGDPRGPIPPEVRNYGRNAKWEHLSNFDLISMPDKWEYPWYATWDLAFHCISMALIDPDFAKRQLTLMTREWYMHPNGALPAYEWNLIDVNPPVHAWAAWRVYKIDQKQTGHADRKFLEGIFHKLLINFTWWVNRKDHEGNNVFQGGFLGMDNVSIFDRSAPLPTGGHIDQSDGTAWMGFYCLSMMKIALELAREEPIYQDSASKFFEHFLRIATAMVNRGGKGLSLWDEADGFFYDSLHLSDNHSVPLRVRSIVGLLPIFAVDVVDDELLNAMPIFKQRMQWFISMRPNYTSTMACVHTPGLGSRHIISIVTKDKLVRILRYMLDENEFLSEYGIRSLSKYHEKHPFTLRAENKEYRVTYEPAEAESDLFGGNSNWRGPIWFPINYLIIESLQKYHRYYGDSLMVECPTGSGIMMNLNEVATELSKRLIKLFLKDEKGERPIFGDNPRFKDDPYWKDLLLFHEYFHADSGLGLGANHQTGWTALVAKLIQQSGAKSFEKEACDKG